MKFRILVGVLTVAIIALFGMVVVFSSNLKSSQASLKTANDSLETINTNLKRQTFISDSLRAVTQDHLDILAHATDSIYFGVAKKSNTFKSYRTYVNTIGKDGSYYDAALVNLGSFFPNKGYVQLTESSGAQYYEKFKETDNFPDKPLIIAGEPSVAKNNMYRSKRAMRIRRGVIGNPDYPNTSPTGNMVKVGQIVKLLDTIVSGQATWAHIAYGN